MKANFIQKIVFSSTIVLSLFVFSCAKTSSSTRTVKQVDSQVVNPGITNSSNQAADNQNLLYVLNSLERPTEPDETGSLTVTSEIKTPSGLYVPVTTTHVNGSVAGGIYNDSNGASLDIRASCNNTNCDRYVMMITVIKNGSAIHQITALSKKADEFFYIKAVNYSVSNQFFQNLDQAIASYNNIP